MAKVILCILDGWGYRKEKDNNAIALARTPNYNALLQNYPNALLDASGTAVGLPEGQMGNSEVGHITIGAGRIIWQDLPKIHQAITDGSFNSKPIIKNLIKQLKASGKTCHIVGLISDGGTHSHINHIIHLCKLLKDHSVKYALHAITDGRDVAPESALTYLRQLNDNDIEVASLSGRFFAMDRDKRWERTQSYYEAIVSAKADKFTNAEESINNYYKQGILDEFIPPLVHKGYQGMQDLDALIIANFRADRVRQIASCLVDPDFTDFPVSQITFSQQISLTSYSDHLSHMMEVLFTHDTPINTLGEMVAKAGKKQLRIAETEKYAHVTYFLNGGRESVFTDEDRIVIPSPKVKTYDLQPEMSATQIKDKVVEAIKADKYDFICINFANSDMVGHCGKLEPTIKAVETIDKCLGEIQAAAHKHGFEMLITADHGNAECMLDEISHQPLTAHTTNKVPVIYVTDRDISLKDGGLSDVAPTVLELLQIEQPKEMTGKSLTMRTKNLTR